MIRPHTRGHTRSHIRHHASPHRRYMTELDSESKSYTTPTIQFDGVFSIKIKYILNELNQSQELFLLTNGAGTESIGLRIEPTNVMKVISSGRTPGDGNLVHVVDTEHEVELEWNGTQFLLHINGSLDYSVTPTTSAWIADAFSNNLIGKKVAAGTRFRGILKDLSFIDAGEIVRHYKIDEDWVGPSTVVVDYTGSNNGTAVGITDADAQNYTFDGDVSPNTWTGDDGSVINVAQTLINRSMTTLVAANSQYYTIPNIGATTTCKIEVDFMSTPSGVDAAIIYRHSNDRFYIVRTAAGDIRFGHGSAFATFGNVGDGEMHTASLEYTGTHVIGVLDGVELLNTTTNFTGLLDNVGVGRRGDTSGTFGSGIIKDVRITVNGALVRRYALDEDWVGPSTVAVDSISGSNGTAVNITDADAQNYRLDVSGSPDTWTGDDATVIDIAGT